MATKREMSIPRQWDKTKKHGSFAWPKRKSLYPGERSSQNLSKSELARAIRNLSTQAKISLLQPELARAKKEVSEQSLLGPALGGDIDSLPDDPWFSKSPEEKYEDVIQEEHGQYENGVWVGEDEGEEEGALAFAEQEFIKSDDDLGFAENEPEPISSDIFKFLGPQYESGATWRAESDENALDRMARKKMDEDEAAKLNSLLVDHDDELETYDSAPGGSSKGAFFSSGESGGESKGLSPMQKYGAKLVMDMFKEKEERPQQTIGASPLTPGRALDMSQYVSSRRPKKERYRNMGLLGRA